MVQLQIEFGVVECVLLVFGDLDVGGCYFQFGWLFLLLWWQVVWLCGCGVVDGLVWCIGVVGCLVYMYQYYGCIQFVKVFGEFGGCV